MSYWPNDNGHTFVQCCHDA